jgi:predicted nucleotidyltransferase
MNFITELESNENMRKLFGKREIILIKKQLLGAQMTQSERNRLSRDIRKKFDAIKSLIPYEKEFNLKCGSENQKLIEEAKREILLVKDWKKIKRIILFGSIISNEMTLMSDVDLAVDFDSITENEAVLFRLSVSKNFSKRLDIQVYNVLPEKIRKEIDENGRVIYERKD